MENAVLTPYDIDFMLQGKSVYRNRLQHFFVWLAGIQGAIISTLGCVLPSFFICLALAFFYYKYRQLDGMQKILAALRPAVVALIASAGLSILLLGLFGDGPAVTENFRIVEAALFAAGLVLLRKYRWNAIQIIFGSGVVGTLIYAIL